MKRIIALGLILACGLSQAAISSNTVVRSLSTGNVIANSAGVTNYVINTADGAIKVRRGELGKSDYVVTDVDFGGKVEMLNEAVRYIAGSNTFMVVTNGTLFIYNRSTNNSPECIWVETNNLTQIGNQLQIQLNQKGVQIQNNVNSTISANLIEGKAWGKYAPDGTSNPDTNNCVFINSAGVIFGAGYDWATTWVGDQCFAVLCQRGSAITASGSGSSFRIGPNSTNYFGFVSTSSQLIPAQVDGIRTYAVAGTVELDFDYDGSYPSIYWATSLTTPFTKYDPNTLTWRTNAGGTTCTVTIPQENNSSMFFYAMTEQAGLTAFKSTMPVWANGGTVVNKGSTQVIMPEFNYIYTFTNGNDIITIPCYHQTKQ